MSWARRGRRGLNKARQQECEQGEVAEARGREHDPRANKRGEQSWSVLNVLKKHNQRGETPGRAQGQIL